MDAARGITPGSTFDMYPIEYLKGLAHPGHAMTVPRPPGAVEAVLAAHSPVTDSRGEIKSCRCGVLFGIQHQETGTHAAHVAQALVDAGCVLGDDWVVETVEGWGAEDVSGLVRSMGRISHEDAADLRTFVNSEIEDHPWAPMGPLLFRTVTTATRTTAWKASE